MSNCSAIVKTATAGVARNVEYRSAVRLDSGVPAYLTVAIAPRGAAGRTVPTGSLALPAPTGGLVGGATLVGPTAKLPGPGASVLSSVKNHPLMLDEVTAVVAAAPVAGNASTQAAASTRTSRFMCASLHELRHARSRDRGDRVTRTDSTRDGGGSAGP